LRPAVVLLCCCKLVQVDAGSKITPSLTHSLTHSLIG
jgi:hypothetical protein